MREGGRGTRTDRIDGCTGGGGAAVIGCLSGLWTPGGLAGWLAGVVCSSACLYSSSRPAFPARLKIGDTFVCALLSSGLPHCSSSLPSPFDLPPGRTRGIVFRLALETKANREDHHRSVVRRANRPSPRTPHGVTRGGYLRTVSRKRPTPRVDGQTSPVARTVV